MDEISKMSGRIQALLARAGDASDAGDANDLVSLSGIVAYFEKLPMTLSLLEATKIGKHINGVRKLCKARNDLLASRRSKPDKLCVQLEDRAASLIEQWKNLAEQEQQQRRKQAAHQSPQASRSAPLSQQPASSRATQKRTFAEAERDAGGSRAMATTPDADARKRLRQDAPPAPRFDEIPASLLPANIKQIKASMHLPLLAASRSASSREQQPQQPASSMFSRSAGRRDMSWLMPSKASSFNPEQPYVVPSLVELAQRAVTRHLALYNSLGNPMPELVAPCLKMCSAEQLAKLEYLNPILLGHTDDIWKRLVRADFLERDVRAKLDGLSGDQIAALCWRSLYFKLKLEYEERLNRQGAKIRAIAESEELQRRQNQVKHLSLKPTGADARKSGQLYSLSTKQVPVMQPLPVRSSGADTRRPMTEHEKQLLRTKKSIALSIAAEASGRRR